MNGVPGTWLDVFAGHGVGVALKRLKIHEYAVENSVDVIETRKLNGLSEPLYRDAWDVEKSMQVAPEGLWLSPPCQPFSNAGSGEGRKILDTLVAAVWSGLWQDRDTLRTADFGDKRTNLVLTPMLYVHLHKPRFLVLEQVPAVAPIWEAMQFVLRGIGYSVWTGVLDAATYGVPQNRKRAYLIARKDGGVALPPRGKIPPVTMFDAVGWGFITRPIPTLTGNLAVTRSPTGTQRAFIRAIEAGEFVFRPGSDGKASRIAKSGIGAQYPPDSVNVSLEDALILQTYPRDFELFGTKASRQLQIGNSVPPLLAEKIITQLYTEETRA